MVGQVRLQNLLIDNNIIKPINEFNKNINEYINNIKIEYIKI